MNKMLFLVLTLVGCGGRYDVVIPPIEINVVHRISTSELVGVFRSQCERELGGGASSEDVQACAEEKLSQFLEDLSHLAGGA